MSAKDTATKQVIDSIPYQERNQDSIPSTSACPSATSTNTTSLLATITVHPTTATTTTSLDLSSNTTEKIPTILEVIPYPHYDLQEYLEKSKKRFEDHWDELHVIYQSTLSDFESIRTLGMGTFGRVLLVKEKANNTYFAMKVMDKNRIVKTKKVEHTLNEKKILQMLNFPFTVYMEYFFKDNSYLYFLMPFVAGGELYSKLQAIGRFNESQTCFYAAQVVLALEYLHYLNLIHRDLKPENILIDSEGYIKLADFGLSKIVKGRTYTICGTPYYMAPEIILSKGYGKAVDWWATGVLIYEMCAGFPPFEATELIQIYEKITTGNFCYVSHFSTDLNDILSNILQVDITKRMGNLKDGVNDIKEHVWFRSTEWLALFNRKVDVPFVPCVTSPGDASNFNKYHEEPLVIATTDNYASEFANF